MSTSEPLGMATFERLLQIHGSRVERWPEAAREPLRLLLASSEVALARWGEAKQLDGLLDALPEVEPTAALMARITSLPARHPRTQRAVWWPFQSSLTPLFAWGAAAALGVLIGVASPDFAATAFDSVDLVSTDSAGLYSDAPADVAALDTAQADDDGADDWAELSGVAMGADWASEDD
jgi:hypothetical protein